MRLLSESVIVGIFTGLLTGWITSTLVTHYYRERDNERDKKIYINNLKRHIISVYRILKQIYIGQNDDEVGVKIEDLRNEFLYAPIYENRFKLSKEEREIFDTYMKYANNIQHSASKYSEFRDYLKHLKKHSCDNIYKEMKDKQDEAMTELRLFRSSWLTLMNQVYNL